MRFKHLTSNLGGETTLMVIYARLDGREQSINSYRVKVCRDDNVDIPLLLTGAEGNSN